MKPRSGWWSFRTRHPEPAMSLPRTVADVIDSHVTLELESLDRVYLSVYQPKLQTPRAVFHFLRDHYGEGAVSSHKIKAITEQFLRSMRFRAGWPQGIAPLGLPRIRTCPFRHTALHIMNSLRDGSLSESAIRLVPDAATVVGSCTRLWVSMHPPCVPPTVS